MYNHYVKWRKCDLHIHSNASIGDSSLTVDEILEEALEKGLDLIALTDHNTVDNIDEFIAKSKEKGIGALPGVELKIEMGRPAVHIIALFPEQVTQETIKDDFLSPLGVTRRRIIEVGAASIHNKGDENQFYKAGLYEIAVNLKKASKLAHELGGIVIAHAGEKHGTFEKVPHTARDASSYEVWNALGAEKTEIMQKNVIDVCELSHYDEEQINFYLDTFYKPTIICSDAHQRDLIGTNYTWIKMDTVDFEGLRQIIYEPDIRIGYSDDAIKNNYFYIQCLKADGGYFNDFSMELSPDLNTIIGGNSAGKSVLIDYLRFVVNDYPQKKIQEEYFERLHDLLRNGNSVEINVFIDDSDLFSQRRTLKMSKDYGASPVDESEPPVITPTVLRKGMGKFCIEVYSQGELIQIIKQKEQISKILDGLGNYRNVIEFIDELVEFIVYNKDNILSSYQEIKEHSEKLLMKEDLKIKIENTKSKIEHDIINEFQRWQYEKSSIEIFEQNINKVKSLVQEYFKEINELLAFEIDIDKIQNKIFINELLALNHEINDVLRSTRGMVEEKLSTISTSVEKLIKNHNWQKKFEEKKTKYNEYLKEKKIENLDIDMQNINTWTKTIIDIDKKNVPKYENLKLEINEYYQVRKMLLCLLDETLNELQDERIKNTEDLKQRYPDIEFEVKELDNEKLYSFLEDQLQGLGIYNFDQQIKRIRTSNVGLTEFVELIETKDTRGLTNRCNITESTSEKIIDFFNEPLAGFEQNFSSSFMELQEIILEPKINFIIIDRNTGVKTNFMRLSAGKKCSFLLSILFSSNDCPLIIDQPEDNLDSEYIQTIIDALKDNKGKRQFIIVTHNQNITVLGDSEKVVKIQKDESAFDPDQGSVVATGGVEREDMRKGILLLEGGTEAFKKRARKYGIKLT